MRAGQLAMIGGVDDAGRGEDAERVRGAHHLADLLVGVRDQRVIGGDDTPERRLVGDLERALLLSQVHDRRMHRAPIGAEVLGQADTLGRIEIEEPLRHGEGRMRAGV